MGIASGSKVLTYSPTTMENESESRATLGGSGQGAKVSPGMTQMMDLFGVGDHGGGPTRAMLDEGLHWMEPGEVAADEAVRHRAAAFNRS